MELLSLLFLSNLIKTMILLDERTPPLSFSMPIPPVSQYPLLYRSGWTVGMMRKQCVCVEQVVPRAVVVMTLQESAHEVWVVFSPGYL